MKRCCPVSSALNPYGGYDFDAYEHQTATDNAALILPDWVAETLNYGGINTLDPEQFVGPKLTTTAIDTRSAALFAATASNNLDMAGARKSKVDIAPMHMLPGQTSQATDDLSTFQWSPPAEDGSRTLEKLKVVGVDVPKGDMLGWLRGLAFGNLVRLDMRKNGYPPSLDHLVHTRLDHLRRPWGLPPPLSEGGRLLAISLGGNNTSGPIAKGFGAEIGGNCKLIIHEGLDENGQVDSVKVLHDLGSHLSPKDTANEFAVADIIDHHPDVQLFVCTHSHLDHNGGYVAAVKMGLMKGKTLAATPKVLRKIRAELKKFPDIPETDYPAMVPIKGEGFIHLEKNGVKRLTVAYNTEATPHSALCTPFAYIGRVGAKWVGTYLNPGDARFGKHNAENYKGPVPEWEYLDKDWFRNLHTKLVAADRTIDPEVANRRITLFDVDASYANREGWAPTIPEIQNNTFELFNEYFSDLGIIDAVTSTNETGIETRYRVATRLGRDMVTWGANLQATSTTFNVMGMNDKLLKATDKHDNNQKYMDKDFLKIINNNLQILEEKYKSTEDVEQKKSIEKQAALENAVKEAFLTLRDTKNKRTRYGLRNNLKAKIKEEFGVERSLGSITVGRVSKTSRLIAASANSIQRYFLCTGTQGNNVEIDSVLSCLADGRSLLDARQKDRHTARPLNPHENVVCISQPAIGKNGAKQRAMVDKIVARGFIVVLAMDDGFVVRGLSPARRKTMYDALLAKGRAATLELDGAITVVGMPIHAKGHGYKKDIEGWIRLVRPDYIGVQHTADPKCEIEVGKICDSLSQRHLQGMIKNFKVAHIDGGNSAAQAAVRIIGQVAASLWHVVIDRKIGTYHGGTLKITQHVVVNGVGDMTDNGLTATVQPGGALTREFAVNQGEVTELDSKYKEFPRPQPIKQNLMGRPDERPVQGWTHGPQMGVLGQKAVRHFKS